MESEKPPHRFEAKTAIYLCAASFLVCTAIVLFHLVEAAGLRSQMTVLRREELQLQVTNERELLEMLKELDRRIALGIEYVSATYSYDEARRERDRRIGEIGKETRRLRAARYSHFTSARWSGGFCAVFALAIAGCVWVQRKQSRVTAAGSASSG